MRVIQARAGQAAPAPPAVAHGAGSAAAELAQQLEEALGAQGAPVIAGARPSQVYEAYRNQRTELSGQLRSLQEERNDISNRLHDETLTAADRKGLEQRIQNIDQRITQTDAALAVADANVARAAAVPGAVMPPPPEIRHGPPDEVYVLTGIFMFVVLFPLSIAYARRIWKRSAAAVMQIPQELYERFSRLDQSVDAIAIEVERIGEGQRYLTKLQSDQRVLGAGAAERVELPIREREGQPRK